MDARKIRRLRSQLGLTQEQFGELFGKQRMAVTRWESGLRTPIAADRRAMEVLERLVRQLLRAT